ncbi:MAG TPA: helix-turn-helix transcriptional regulator [Pyrinomonadaceae bacterium]|nr:helix-turn-helix transcriptional regulator [Pyrinomonadaceae bacterium]
MSKHKNIGSNLDDLLAEEGELDEVTAVAVKRVIAWQLSEAMKESGISKSALAKRMHTSRTVVDRILDATDDGLTLDTMTRAANALGRRLKIDLVAV